MKPVALLGGAIFGLVLLSLATLRGELLVLSIPLVVYLLISLWTHPEKLSIDVTRQVSATRVMQNCPVIVDLDISNKGDRLEEVSFQDVLPYASFSVEGSTGCVTGLPAGGEFHIHYSLLAGRGSIHFTGIKVIARDCFGLMQHEQKIPAPGELLVLLSRTRLHRMAIQPFSTRTYAGPIPSRTGGAGVTFFGLRDYQPGDPYRWINWRVTAQHRYGLFVNEFEQERVTDVGIILDARQHNYMLNGSTVIFERAVEAANSLAELFLGDGHRVSLLVFGWRQVRIFPGYGKIQRERILRCLAGVETSEGRRLETLPAYLFPLRSQIILISPLEETDLGMLVGLRGQGYEVCVVSPDPVSHAENSLPDQVGADLAFRIARIERALLFNQLRKAGVFIVDWRVDDALDRAISKASGWNIASRRAFNRIPRHT